MSELEALRFTRGHEWVRLDGPVATVGVTRFAVDQLGDIVFLDLPAHGSSVVAGEPCGEVESTKSVSDVYAPVTGTVVERNAAAIADPSMVNTDPHGTGWLLRVEVTEEPRDLLDPTEYAELTGGHEWTPR